MRDTVIGRILFYLAIWAGLFLVLCIISVVKNWAIVVAAVSGTVSSLIGPFFVIGLIIYGIVRMLTSVFR